MSSGDQQITFVSHTNKPGGGELALRRYLEATRLPVRLVTFEAGGVWEGITAEVVEVGGLFGLRQEVRGERLVVANSMRSAFLTALVLPSRARLVYWVRDGLTNSAMTRTALTLTKHVTAKRVSHYLANSIWTANTVRDVLGVAVENVDVVHSMCGVSAKDLDRRPRSQAHAPIRLLYLGRIAPWKGPDIAVRAVDALRGRGTEATLTLAGGAHFGEERYEAEVRRLVEAEPAVTMLGHVDDVKTLLTDHDVLLHCSTLPEPFGQVIVQGLAAGMPVVAPKLGGPAETLTGAPIELLYEPGDVQALAAAVRRVVVDFGPLSAWAVSRAARYVDEELLLRADEVLTALSSREQPPSPGVG